MGPGTLKLTAYNDYSGGTTVSGGTLSFAARTASAAGRVVVDPGNGQTAGLTWVSNSPDLTVNGLTLASGHTVFDLGGRQHQQPRLLLQRDHRWHRQPGNYRRHAASRLRRHHRQPRHRLRGDDRRQRRAGLRPQRHRPKPYVVPGAIGGGGGLQQKAGYLVLTGSKFTRGAPASAAARCSWARSCQRRWQRLGRRHHQPQQLLQRPGLNRSDSVTVSGQLTGIGNLLQTGPGRLILTGSNVYGNATINSGAVLEIDSSTSVGTGSLSDSGSLVFNAPAGTTVSLAVAITGAGSVVQQGSGSTVWLKASNSYSGGTTLTAGTLEFGSGLGVGPVYVNPGNGNTAGLTWYNNSWDPTATGRGLTLASGNTLFTLGGYNVAFAGAIAGTGSLEISGGTLQIGNLTNTGSLGNLSAVTLDAGGVLAFDRSDTSSVTGAIAGSGSLIQKAGTLVLTGSNIYTGGTTVSGGTLQF